MTTEPKSITIATLPDRWIKLGLGVVLAALAAVAILPAYFTGQWPWVATPQVMQIDQLKALQSQGLELPGWEQTSHQQVTINQQDWSFGEYTPQNSSTESVPGDRVALLLLPQPWHSNQPQVEWLDITGAQQWQIDSRQRLAVADPANPSARFQARFFRSWNGRQTFAVLQWYAWPGGGHPSPSHWFWANQWSQLTSRTLTPWVAVSLLIPIDPMGDIIAYAPLAMELGAQIQRQLEADTFALQP
ncbi:MAG: cyanoexosortase B system-associated protein [Leptolyngbyaceae cyanobacterium SM2_3_12]|nr:cyanoexosortase B system-associated protein [Leptolyngbyaceae cyanobacterium SM2_3_12]